MADFAPHYTARYRVRYTSLGQQHAMVFRVAPTATPAERASLATNFLDALAGYRNADWTVLGAEYAGENSIVFLPATAPTPVVGGATTPDTTHRPMFLSFQGRGAEGARARLVLYGVYYPLLGGPATVVDYRVTSAENAIIGDAVAVLNDAPIAIAIDRSKATYYPYANLGLNAYYQRKQRG